MKRKLCWALMVLAPFSAASAVAQDCDQGLSNFRVALDGFVADLHELGDAAEVWEVPAAQDFQGAVVELGFAIAEADVGEMTELCHLFERSPSLIGAPRVLVETLDQTGQTLSSGLCPPDYVQYILMGTAFVLEGVKIVAEGACNVAGCWDKIGATCTTLCVLAGVADGAALIANFAVDFFEGECMNEHMSLLEQVDADVGNVWQDVLINQNAITAGLDVPVSSRATQVSVDGVTAWVVILDDKLGTPHDDIATDIATLASNVSNQGEDRVAYQDLSVQLAIEEALQSGNGRVSLFQLPSSVGGKLELVREVVSNAIAMTVAAGENVHHAHNLFGLGDQQFNNHEYKAAFGFYRQAYQEATREGVRSWGDQ